ncbi:MAG: RIP metalloprotease RseP [Proteobacteria bacterium]|nr:RIP metalloprotease RseP [Pseudomonadota bacterium]
MGGQVLTSVIGVIVLLGGLIFFHELGHYSVAKFFKVKVEAFSLGFGKKIFKKRWGETEYCLSLIPLGGYVKLMGDDPYQPVPADEVARAFSTQALYKRFLIVAAGPLANLILAYALFIIVFWVGQPQVNTRLGNVSNGSPAWKAGLRSGDKILSLNSESVLTWQQMDEWLRVHEGQTAELLIERNQSELKLSVPVSRVQGKNPYGEDEMVGGIKGISPTPLASVVGVSDPKSLASQAGIRTGDLIKRVGSKPVLTYEDLDKEITAQWQRSLTLTYQRSAESPSKEGAEVSVELKLPEKPVSTAGFQGVADALGLSAADTFVRQVSKDSPAETGGLKAGDHILKVGEERVYNFESIVEAVQDYGNRGTPITLTVQRDGKTESMTFKPIETTQEDPITQQPIKKFIIGFAPQLVFREPETTKVQIRNLLPLLGKAVNETNQLAKKMVISLVKLATGSISLKNLGGPVLIATVAGKSLDAGIVQFLQMMALISINLFLLNLFPVPILDGGHLLFFSIEAIKGKPVTIRTMEIANQIGMVFILMLVVLTLFNDISRIIPH